MAVHKAIRSKSPAQPRPQHAKSARIAIPDRAKAARSGNPAAEGPGPQGHGANHQLKAEIFDVLRHLNRGFGVAMSALDKLEYKDRLPGPRIFPGDVINDYRYRTESLRAEANRDLLRLISGHEDQETERWGRLRAQQVRRGK
jgi:hypothetical protein